VPELKAVHADLQVLQATAAELRRRSKDASSIEAFGKLEDLASSLMGLAAGGA
jgi:hypothetical protein